MIFERTPSGVLFFGHINNSMTALTRTPENTNALQPTKFMLSLDRIASVNYFCQGVNIPGVSIGQAPINLPTADIYAPGNKITYNQLTVDFLVDSSMNNWQQIHAWFRSIASPESFEERKRLSDLQNQYNSNKLKNYSDGTLTLLSSLNNPIKRIHFVNLFPISLSDIQFDTRMTADDVITASVTFVYDYFNFVDA